MAEHQVTEAEIDASIAAAFGRCQDADPGVRAALREAGYGDELVEQGLRMWATGAYFGFEDLATSLGTSRTLGRGNRSVAPAVSEASIARAAKRLEERANTRDEDVVLIDGVPHRKVVEYSIETDRKHTS